MATSSKAKKDTTAPVVAEAPAKAPTKMDQAKVLFQEIYSDDYKLEGSSQRKVFIERAQAEIGLSKAGANTYFQNLTNLAKGQSLYKYNQYEAKPKAEGATAEKPAKAPKAAAKVDDELPGAKAPSKAAVKKAEAKVQADLSKRWQVWNAKKSNQVNSFGTKKAAEEYASQATGLEVRDSKAS